ncbi:hypothetical protein STAQ_12060 [Allostella sp. ATCC 35155]|nr:hypothetical protein STAQ_12060 [Stella sp. ATCC 35155]
MLHFPVISLAAEHLAMGHLLRRNILTYKAPPGNEGYDLICMHPDPRSKIGKILRIQVKSRYQTDCDRGFPVKQKSIDAFDYLIVAFLNVGKFFGKNDGSSGQLDPEFYTLPREFIKTHHHQVGGWEKVMLKNLSADIAPYRNEAGFENIAVDLGVERPRRPPPHAVAPPPEE